MNSIVMMLSCHALGELMVRNLYLCCLSRHFPSSTVYAVVDPQTPDQALSLLLNPRIDYMLVADHLSSKFWADISWIPGDWAKKREPLAYPTLFVPPNGLTLGHEALSFEGIDPNSPSLIMRDVIDNTVFGLPPEIKIDSERQLLERGLARDRWFITLHVREDGYRSGGRRVPLQPRSVGQVERYAAVVDYIIAQGGQVVRLGDPTMTELPERPGFVDLSRVPGSFLVQAYACSRSRFLIGGDSGPTVIATAFNTPTALVNMVNPPVPSTAPKNHILATKGFRLGDGRAVWDLEAESLGFMNEEPWYYEMSRLEEMSSQELCHVSELMLARTEAVSGWVEREPTVPDFWTPEHKISAADIERRNSWRRIYLSEISPRQL